MVFLLLTVNILHAMLAHIQNDLLYICFLLILLARRLIRFYLNIDAIVFKLLSIVYKYVKLPLNYHQQLYYVTAQISCFCF